MEKLTMCRICLVENVSMYEVASKDLQEMYEKLTDIPFVTEDCRPMLACFFCYAKLKQCCLFQRKCLKAEEVFAQMLNGYYEQIPLEFQGVIEFYGGFIQMPIEHMSIDDVCQTESGAVREQLAAVCDIKDAIFIEPTPQLSGETDKGLKEEYLIKEVKVEYDEDSYQDQEDIPSHHSESDSEDDVPLKKFKTEVEEEQEVPEENTRTPVAKKPELDIRKAKLEDTIITSEHAYKQKKSEISDWKIIHTTRKKTTECVTKVREPIASDTIAKPKVNILKNKDKVIIEETPNQSNVKDIINTAIDTYFLDNSNQDHFRCKIFNDKGNNSDDTNMHKIICKTYSCDRCGRSFSTQCNLKRHIRLHTGEKPYKCEICQRSFTQKHTLTSHIRTHTGEKPYKCEICQRSFNKQYSLKKHIGIHTGEKPYKCVICQHSFKAKGSLEKHIRVHTSEKPYECKICQRTFNRTDSLKDHIRTHTGEKPYKCTICQRSFNKRNLLSKHIRIHTGEKPYKCDICQRSYSQSSSLKAHKIKCSMSV